MEKFKQYGSVSVENKALCPSNPTPIPLSRFKILKLDHVFSVMFWNRFKLLSFLFLQFDSSAPWELQSASALAGRGWKTQVLWRE